MIKISNLKFKYSDAKTYAIKNLSLEIPKGKFIAVLGHNGSGKSTLSKILVGLYKPTAGEVEIDGTTISKKTLKTIRKKISIVFQNPENQFVGSTVEDDIAFGLENKQIKDQGWFKKLKKSGSKAPSQKILKLIQLVEERAKLKMELQKLKKLGPRVTSQKMLNLIQLVKDRGKLKMELQKMTREKMHQTVLKYAKMVDMESHLDHEPSSLSGGQKQRVAIASILALDPEIIIFDEVTSMLDPKGKKEVINIIRKVQTDQNKTLISITHDMDEAILADEIIVLANGKLVANGDPKTILNNKQITDLAKIDAPFIYKVSEALAPKNIKLTYDRNELIGEICK